MSIKNLGKNQWQVRCRARINGREVTLKRIISGDRKEARTHELALFEELASQRDKALASPGSLTLKLHTCGDVLKFWTERTTAKLKPYQTTIGRLTTDLGTVRNEEILERFGDFMDGLKKERARTYIGEKMRLLNLERERNGEKPIIRELGAILKPRTRNFYIDVVNRAYNFAVRRGKLKENPLRGYEKEKEMARDRVLSEDEKKAIFKVMLEKKSYLYHAFYFSLMNPIRKGDLMALKRENFEYNQFNPEKSYIHFLPQKTGRYKPREAQLICIDHTLLDYFKGLPADCPFLFPRIDEKGRWYSLGDFKREWHEMLDAAEVSGITWHDLKHCAITWMLDNGFSELDLKNLGIQYSTEMVARYYHKSPDKARGAWDRIQEKCRAAVPNCGTFAQKTA